MSSGGGRASRSRLPQSIAGSLLSPPKRPSNSSAYTPENRLLDRACFRATYRRDAGRFREAVISLLACCALAHPVLRAAVRTPPSSVETWGVGEGEKRSSGSKVEKEDRDSDEGWVKGSKVGCSLGEESLGSGGRCLSAPSSPLRRPVWMAVAKSGATAGGAPLGRAELPRPSTSRRRWPSAPCACGPGRRDCSRPTAHADGGGERAREEGAEMIHRLWPEAVRVLRVEVDLELRRSKASRRSSARLERSVPRGATHV